MGYMEWKMESMECYRVHEMDYDMELWNGIYGLVYGVHEIGYGMDYEMSYRVHWNGL